MVIVGGIPGKQMFVFRLKEKENVFHLKFNFNVKLGRNWFSLEIF